MLAVEVRYGLCQENSPRCQVELRHDVELVDLGRQINVVLLADLDQVSSAAAVAERNSERAINQNANGGAPGIDREKCLVVQDAVRPAREILDHRSGQQRVLASDLSVSSRTKEGDLVVVGQLAADGREIDERPEQ